MRLSTTGYRNAVGAFEGANYHAEGYYRSKQNYLMFTRIDASAVVLFQVGNEYGH